MEIFPKRWVNIRYYRRLLQNQSRSFLLLGPRGTGKSTWVSDSINAKLSINLLNSNEFYKFSAKPSLLYDLAENLRPKDWVLIDEAQKVPQLLNEVHRLIEEKKLNVAITGSSARKLKQVDVNLLGGRATRFDFFPLCFQELQNGEQFKVALDFGTLPLVLAEPDHMADILSTYVATYLKEEDATKTCFLSWN